MKGTETKILTFMDGRKTKFNIPVYQRSYSWSTKQCEQLFNDLVRISEEDRDSHFFGSVVSVIDFNEIDEYMIIDGQQRLTTISLLLLAMYHQLKKGNLVSNDSELDEKIYEDYLIDHRGKNFESSLKLQSSKDDKMAYIRLFEDEDDYIHSSNITINFKYFCKRILDSNISIDELYKSINKLEIIDIRLDPRYDDPQLIFESLNSTGLALEEGDKVRNFILMDASFENQAKLYDRYWNKIENYVGDNLTMFIRDYLSSKTRVTPAISKVYPSFKDYVKNYFLYHKKEYNYENSFDEVEEDNYDNKDNFTLKEILLKDMLSYARNYNILLTGDGINPSIESIIDRLNRLETTVTRPYFLSVLNLYNDGVIDQETLQEIFLLIETYIFRRSIVGIATNSLNKIFVALNNDVYKLEENYDDYLNKLNYILLRKQGNGRFPRNNEFIDSFSTRDIYFMNSKTKTYIMERFENFGTREDKDIYAHVDAGDYQIEHIMPQKLDSDWIKDLGSDYEVVHENWLHRVANLTLTAYNAKYQNSSFKTKKTIDNGYIQSGLRMNQYIARYDKWTEDELNDRNQHLMDRAKQIWKEPITSFVLPAKEKIELNLSDEDLDLKGYKVVGYQMDDRIVEVDNFTRAYIEIIEYLYDLDSSIMVDFARNDSQLGVMNSVSFDPNRLINPEKVNDFYVEKNWNNNNKVRNLREFFDTYNIDQSKLSFFIDDEK